MEVGKYFQVEICQYFPIRDDLYKKKYSEGKILDRNQIQTCMCYLITMSSDLLFSKQME